MWAATSVTRLLDARPAPNQCHSAAVLTRRLLEQSGGGSGSEAREVDSGMKDARVALKAAKRKDFYKILEVDRGADDEELKKA